MRFSTNSPVSAGFTLYTIIIVDICFIAPFEMGSFYKNGLDSEKSEF